MNEEERLVRIKQLLEMLDQEFHDEMIQGIQKQLDVLGYKPEYANPPPGGTSYNHPIRGEEK